MSNPNEPSNPARKGTKYGAGGGFPHAFLNRQSPYLTTVASMAKNSAETIEFFNKVTIDCLVLLMRFLVLNNTRGRE